MGLLVFFKGSQGKLCNEVVLFVKMQVVLVALFFSNYLKFILLCLTQNILFITFTAVLCKC